MTLITYISERSQDHGDWSRARIDQVVASGRSTIVALKKPVPVLLLYWTASADPDGQVRFLTDIYGRDPAVLSALNGAFRYRERFVRTDAQR